MELEQELEIEVKSVRKINLFNGKNLFNVTLLIGKRTIPVYFIASNDENGLLARSLHQIEEAYSKRLNGNFWTRIVKKINRKCKIKKVKPQKKREFDQAAKIAIGVYKNFSYGLPLPKPSEVVIEKIEANDLVDFYFIDFKIRKLYFYMNHWNGKRHVTANEANSQMLLTIKSYEHAKSTWKRYGEPAPVTILSDTENYTEILLAMKMADNLIKNSVYGFSEEQLMVKDKIRNDSENLKTEILSRMQSGE